MIGILRKLLHYAGIISMHSKPDNVQNNYKFRWLLIIYSSTYLPLVLLDIVINGKSLEHLSESCNLNIPGIQACLKFYCIMAYMPRILEILDELDDISLNAGNTSLAKKMIYIRAFMTTFSMFYYSISGVLLKQTGLPFVLWLPYDNTKNTFIYWTTALVLFSIMLFISCTSVTVENFLSVNLIYITQRLQNLQSMIREDKLDVNINSCIKNHQKILKISEKLHPIISIMTFMHFIGVTTSVAMTALLIVKELNFQNYGNSLNHVFFIITVVSLGSTNYYLSERITTQSLLVREALYGSNWIDSPLEVKKNILFAITRAQKPIQFSVGGLFNFSLNTYLQMMKNCYSIFALMYSKI